MDDCCGCSPVTDASASDISASLVKFPCPTNHQVGKAVDSITLKSLLALPLTAIRPAAYRFCRDPNCPTVYYSVDGGHLISEGELREKVYQKHPAEADILVCYCLKHTVGSIRREYEQGEPSTVIAQINAAIQSGQCACDIRNPQGNCCLGNVTAVVQQLRREFGAE